MSERRLAVVGGGQMGRALVGGMLAADVLSADQIDLVEPNQDARQWWSKHQPEIKLTDLRSAVDDCEYVLLAIKPNVIAEVARQDDSFWKDKLIVSIAAGIALDDLCQWIGHQRVARVMPNTPSLVGAGASAFCWAAEVSDDDQRWIETMLQSVGLAVAVAESQMDAVTGLSGSGPAYVCMMVEAMADGGVLAGLPRPLAMQLATQTVLGTAKMIAQTQQHPGELKDAVASPAGTTIAAISELEQHGFRGAVIEAVAASARRSQQLGCS